MRKYEKASKGEMASAMKKIIEYMKGSVGIVAVALVLAALGAVLTIIGPDKVGEITDLIADGLIAIPADEALLGRVSDRLRRIDGSTFLIFERKL